MKEILYSYHYTYILYVKLLFVKVYTWVSAFVTSSSFVSLSCNVIITVANDLYGNAHIQLA